MTIGFFLFSVWSLLTSCAKDLSVKPENQDLKSRIISAAKANHIPTLSVFIKSKNEELKFQYQDTDKNIEPVKVYGIGSTTKLLSSIIILKYVEENKINLEKHITEYISKDSLPSLPWVDSIKVKHLLNHTSGIPDFTQNPSWISLITSMKPPKSFKERMQLVVVPDTIFALDRFAYSSSNFVILEKILEITGHQKATDIFNTFYSNLGLVNTSFNKPSTGTQAFFAQQVNGTSNVSAWEENYGFEGGAYSTVEDLYKLMQQIFVDKTVINSQSLASIQSWVDMDRFKINFGNGKITSYGLGLMKYEISGRIFIGHPGSSLKYQCFAFIEPATGFQIVLLTNCSGKYYNNAFLIEIIDKIISKKI